MTVATLLLTCLIFVLLGWVGTEYRLAAPLDRRDRLHRGVERRDDVAGPQDGLPRRRHAAAAADRDPGRGPDLGDRDRLHAPPAQRRRARSYTSKAEYLPTVHATEADLTQEGRPIETETGRTARITTSGGSSTPGRGSRPASTSSIDSGRRVTSSTRRSTGGSISARRRLEGHEVRRPQGHADGPDHRRHHERQAPLGPGPDLGC